MTLLGRPHHPGDRTQQPWDGGGAGPQGNGSITAVAPPHQNWKKREVVTAMITVISAVVKVAGQN